VGLSDRANAHQRLADRVERALSRRERLLLCKDVVFVASLYALHIRVRDAAVLEMQVYPPNRIDDSVTRHFVG